MNKEQIVKIVEEVLDKREAKKRPFDLQDLLQGISIHKICLEEIVPPSPKNEGKKWHPSDEALLETSFDRFIDRNADMLGRSALSIKYKIAKMLKESGVKV